MCEVDQWVESVKDCKYLPENDLKKMEVTSDWESEDSSKLSDILQKCDEIPDGNLAELLDEDKCISLLPSSSDANICTLRFECNTDQNLQLAIESLLILSEAALCEVFVNKFQEYYKTFFGKITHSSDDSKIYKILINFEKPVSHVVMKLKHMTNFKSVWIYGLYVKTSESVPSHSACSSSFSNENVTSVLSERGIQLSEKAESFQKMLGQFNNSKYENPVVAAPGGYPPMSLMAMMMASATNHATRMASRQAPILTTNTQNISDKYSACSDLAINEQESLVFPDLYSQNYKKTDNFSDDVLNLKEYLHETCDTEKELDNSTIKSTADGTDLKMEKFITKMQHMLVDEKHDNSNKGKLMDLLSMIPQSCPQRLSIPSANNPNVRPNAGTRSMPPYNLPESSINTLEARLMLQIESTFQKKISDAEARIKHHMEIQIEKQTRENNKKIDQVLKLLEKISGNS